MKGAGVLTFCPGILKRYGVFTDSPPHRAAYPRDVSAVGPLLPWPRRAIHALRPLLKPAIEERRSSLDEHGKSEERLDEHVSAFHDLRRVEHVGTY